MKSFIMKKVVCIGNDLKLNQLVTNYFSDNHIRVIVEQEKRQAGHILSLESDVLLIDLSPSDVKNNYALAKQIREISDIPILFASSGKNEDTVSKAINFRCADYMRKPLDLHEMAERMNRLITFTSNFSNMNKLKFGEATLLLCEQAIEYEDIRIHLSRMETKILYKLYQYRNEYIDKSTLVCKVWETTDYNIRKGTLGNILWKIRKKIKCLDGISIDTGVSAKIRLIVPEQTESQHL